MYARDLVDEDSQLGYVASLVMKALAEIERLEAELAAERERAAELLEAARDLFNSDIGAEPELSQPYAMRRMADVLARYEQRAGDN
jgi:hypothetical protein